MSAIQLKSVDNPEYITIAFLTNDEKLVERITDACCRIKAVCKSDEPFYAEAKKVEAKDEWLELIGSWTNSKDLIGWYSWYVRINYIYQKDAFPISIDLNKQFYYDAQQRNFVDYKNVEYAFKLRGVDISFESETKDNSIIMIADQRSGNHAGMYVNLVNKGSPPSLSKQTELLNPLTLPSKKPQTLKSSDADYGSVYSYFGA